jgi:hypothetical protein
MALALAGLGNVGFATLGVMGRLMLFVGIMVGAGVAIAFDGVAMTGCGTAPAAGGAGVMIGFGGGTTALLDKSDSRE